MRTIYLLILFFVQLVCLSCSEQGVYADSTSKQIIKNETGIKKIKGIVKITGNQFLWKDIVEKMTLLIREHM